MLKTRIICIGKLKERYWTEAVAEYSKRLKSYCDLEITELKEAPLRPPAGPAEEEAVKKAEGEAILESMGIGQEKNRGGAGFSKAETFVVTLEVKGKKLSSEQLASRIEELGIQGKSEIIFIIGGSLGLSEEVSRAADLKLSFSDMTFPHQMMRVILLEQIYRSFKINRGEPYHK